VFKVLQAACINPALHYNMKVGLLRTGDSADFIVVKDLVDFEVMQTYIDGLLVAENGKTLIKTKRSELLNNFDCNKKKVEDFIVPLTTNIPLNINVIEALDGQLITNKLFFAAKVEYGNIVSDPVNDILKIVVVNRYKDAPVAKAFIINFGIKRGAIASSVAHDSHNIVAVGSDDWSICRAVNLIIEQRGGVSLVSDSGETVLALPVAGLMSNEDGYKVAEEYMKIDQMAKQLGSKLTAPFMTLSFMALLVIPHLKLSDKGLFDGDEFRFI
jgi:adenine deaminase